MDIVVISLMVGVGAVILIATVFIVGGTVAIALIPAKAWAGKAQWFGWLSGLSLASAGFALVIGQLSPFGLYMLLAALVLLAFSVVMQVQHPRPRAIPFPLGVASFMGLVVAVPFVDIIAANLGFSGSVNAVADVLTQSFGVPFSRAPHMLSYEFGWDMERALLFGAVPYAVVAGFVAIIVSHRLLGKSAPGVLAFAWVIGATGAGSLAGGLAYNSTGASWSLLLGLAVASLGTAAYSLFTFARTWQREVEPGNLENQVLRYLEEHHYQVSLSVMAHELSIAQDELKGILEALQKKGHVQL